MKVSDGEVNNMVYELNNKYLKSHVYVEYIPMYIDKKAYLLIKLRDLSRKEVGVLFNGKKVDLYRFIVGMIKLLRLINLSETSLANVVSRKLLVDYFSKFDYIEMAYNK
jgi:hypothetical protein